MVQQQRIVNVSVVTSPAIRRKIAERRSSSKQEVSRSSEMEGKKVGTPKAAAAEKKENMRRGNATYARGQDISRRVAEAGRLRMLEVKSVPLDKLELMTR